MDIKVLGSGCPSCKKLLENTRGAVDNNSNIQITYVTELSDIISMGIMQTPALVIDNKVVSAGRVLSVDEIKKIIDKY